MVELPKDDMERAIIQAMYELSLEACGGREEVLLEMAQSGNEDNMPKILESDIKKRVEEIFKEGRLGHGRKR